MNPYLIEASVEETTNFLRCMAYLALKIRNDAVEDGSEVDLSAIEAKTEGWRKAALPFLKRYGINEVAFNNALKMARANNPQYRNVAKSFRDKLADKVVLNKVKADFKNVTDPQKGMLADLSSYLNSMSEPGFQRVKKNIGILVDGDLGLGFNPDTASGEDDEDASVGSHDKALKAIRIATKGIKPSSGTPFLTFSELKTLAEKNPAAAEKYKAAYKQLSDTFKAALKVVVLKSGERYMPVADAMRELKKRGINYNLFAKGSDHPNIYVNELGHAGTQGNVPIKGNPSLIVPTLIVTPNPAFDPETQTGGYVFRHTQSDSGKAPGFQQKAYSSGQAKQSAAKKSGMVNDLMNNLANYRKKWRDDLDVDESLHQVVSTITELVYLTAARVQAQGGTSKGEATFGVQSWLVRHVKKLDNKSVSFVFPAKSGKIQNPVISVTSAEPEDRAAVKQILANLKTFMAGKKPDDPLFTYKGKKLSPNALRQYLGSIGVKATPHKFRHARGNNIFLKEIAKSNLKPGVSQTEANKFFKDVMAKVGQSLGHMAMDKEGNNIPTGATAMRYYVDPELMGQFFTDLGLRPPPVVVDRMGDGEGVEPVEPTAPIKTTNKRGKVKTAPEPEDEEEFQEEPDYDDDEDDDDSDEMGGSESEPEPEPEPPKQTGKRGRPPKAPAPAPEPEPESATNEPVLTKINKGEYDLSLGKNRLKIFFMDDDETDEQYWVWQNPETGEQSQPFDGKKQAVSEATKHLTKLAAKKPAPKKEPPKPAPKVKPAPEPEPEEEDEPAEDDEPTVKEIGPKQYEVKLNKNRVLVYYQKIDPAAMGRKIPGGWTWTDPDSGGKHGIYTSSWNKFKTKDEAIQDAIKFLKDPEARYRERDEAAKRRQEDLKKQAGKKEPEKPASKPKSGKSEPEAAKPIGKGDVIEFKGKKIIILNRIDEGDKTRWVYIPDMKSQDIIKEVRLPTTGPNSLDAQAKKVGFIELPGDDDEDDDAEPEFDEEDDDDQDEFDSPPPKKSNVRKTAPAKPAPRRRAARYSED